MRFRYIFFAFLCLASIIFARPLTYAQNYVLEFNGVGDHVQLDDDIGDGIRSVELWFYINHDYNSSSNTPRSLFIRNTDGEFGEFGLCLSAFPEYRGNLLFFKRREHAFYYAISDNNVWAENTWYHVAGTVDPEEGMKLYINGELQQKTDISTEATDIRNEVVAIGKWGDWDTRYWDGKMDEIRVWNRALSQEEIQEKMCRTLNPEEEVGLKGYYQFNEGEGNISNDLSGNMNGGLIIGAEYEMEEICQVNSSEPIDKVVKIVVSPNPATDILTFEFTGMESPIQISIYDSLGRRLRSLSNIVEPTLHINVNDFPPGVYLYSVVTKAGKITRKVVVE